MTEVGIGIWWDRERSSLGGAGSRRALAIVPLPQL